MAQPLAALGETNSTSNRSSHPSGRGSEFDRETPATHHRLRAHAARGIHHPCSIGSHTHSEPQPPGCVDIQPTDLRLGTSAEMHNLWRAPFGYDDPVTGGNNGNVYSQVLDAPGLPATLTQAYSYDDVNRLTGVAETGGVTNWSRAYDYDPYGNRAAQGLRKIGDCTKRRARKRFACLGLKRSAVDCPQFFPGVATTTANPNCDTGDLDFDAATNRLEDTWAGYDAAGNLITFKPNTYEWTASYDADNKQTASCPGTESACNGVAAGSKTTYDYDGNGNRVRKIVDNDEKSIYVYNAFGNLAAEYANFAPTGPAGTQYRTTDHLGSTRIVTDATPAPNTVVLSRRDFFPFGEEIMANDTFGNRDDVKDGQATTTYNDPSGYRQQFTGKERDSESGLDYFLARYYSGLMGRFLSSDEPFSDQWSHYPQTWHLYTHARNNPLKFTDPTGTASVDQDGNFVGDFDGEEFCGLDGKQCVYWSSEEATWNATQPKGNELVDIPLGVLNNYRLKPVG